MWQGFFEVISTLFLIEECAYYKISGVLQTRNAIKLLDYIGYPKEITEKAYKRAQTIEEFI
ncbi:MULTISPECIES: hypothetical protein [Clostridia]|uniref:hypothetical protein n=1 Tax=Clostridium cochlearium TaxID=1494 RepID=UPI001571035F|nr:hypothetical protein [Clostridium cochlearium]MBV1821851.1 hypothetical protein [Bacteroidales bacterium MSK.15.36]MCG4579780.1 hypothetical protein [Clostridium cochlearium]MCR1971676.1 hypothetical protein [Clostridium cochlearium]